MSAFNETHSSLAWKAVDVEAYSWDIQLIWILPSHLASPIYNYVVIEILKSSTKFVNFLCIPSMEYTALFLSLKFGLVYLFIFSLDFTP